MNFKDAFAPLVGNQTAALTRGCYWLVTKTGRPTRAKELSYKMNMISHDHKSI